MVPLIDQKRNVIRRATNRLDSGHSRLTRTPYIVNPRSRDAPRSFCKKARREFMISNRD